jgi:hypothetical protein
VVAGEACWVIPGLVLVEKKGPAGWVVKGGGQEVRTCVRGLLLLQVLLLLLSRMQWSAERGQAVFAVAYISVCIAHAQGLTSCRGIPGSWQATRLTCFTARW